MLGQPESLKSEWESSVREKLNCRCISIVECLSALSAEEILTLNTNISFFGPVADDDFFSSNDTEYESYEQSQR